MNLKDYKIVFFGNSTFSEVVLKELYEQDIVPTLLISSPDTPRGRGQKLQSPPPVEWAREKEVDFMQPEELDEEFIADLSNTDWDLFVVASYGEKLPKKLLKIPSRGALNVHPSMLPKLRGANPVRSAILNDSREDVGVTVMLMDEKMDTGPIVAQGRVELEDWPPTAGVLYDLLAQEGGKTLAEVILMWLKGEITPEEQNDENATYTHKISKEDAEIDFEDDSYKNFLKIQAFTPAPGAYFFTEEGDKQTRVKITEADYDEENDELIIKKVIPAGKKEMDYEDFLKGLNSSK